MNNSIVVSDLTKSYPGGITALRETNLTIPSNKIVGIIGENGSGKSTFLKLLGGFISPDTGEINFMGVSPRKQSKIFRKNLGYLSQHLRLDPEMTILESLSLFSALYGINRKKRNSIIEKLIWEYHLQDHLDKIIRDLSGGLKQRLHIAICMVHHPQFILLDEPTNFLDAAGKQHLWKNILDNKKRGNTIFIVSHDLQAIEKNCDYILIFHKGEVLQKGTIQDVLKQDNSHRMIYFVSGSFEDDKIKARLSELKPIKRLEIRQNQIIASIENTHNLENEIQDILQREKLTIQEKRKRSSDLNTLYFNLTGSPEIRFKNPKLKINKPIR